MAEIDSVDYHDFVIRQGELIGEFEQMYRKSQSTPWHQDEQEDWLDVRLAVDLLRDHAPFQHICDFGCGLGYFLDILRRRLGAEKCCAVGYDVSETCCKDAKEKFSEFDFRVLDLMSSDAPCIPLKIKETSETRLFTIRGTLWYVFPKIREVMKRISSMTCSDDLFLKTFRRYTQTSSVKM